MQVFLFSSLVFSLLVAIFAIQNAVQVTVNFLLWNFQTSLVLVILSSAVIGAMAIFFVGVFRQFTMAHQLREYEHRIKELETKLQPYEEKEKEQAMKEAAADQGP